MPSNRVLLFQFNNADDYLRVFLILGPADETVRKDIFNLASQHDQIFTRRRGALTSKWTTFFRKDFLGSGDYADADMDSIRSTFNTNMRAFIEDDLPSISNTINEHFKDS